MFVRELDLFFDIAFGHGSWFYAALPIALAALGMAFRKGWRTVVVATACMLEHRAFAWLFAGLLVVLVVSRLMGMGEFWQLVLSERYLVDFKRIVEETLELWGYILVFVSSCLYGFSSQDCAFSCQEKDIVEGMSKNIEISMPHRGKSRAVR